MKIIVQIFSVLNSILKYLVSFAAAASVARDLNPGETHNLKEAGPPATGCLPSFLRLSGAATYAPLPGGVFSWLNGRIFPAAGEDYLLRAFTAQKRRREPCAGFSLEQ